MNTSQYKGLNYYYYYYYYYHYLLFNTALYRAKKFFKMPTLSSLLNVGFKVCIFLMKIKYYKGCNIIIQSLQNEPFEGITLPNVKDADLMTTVLED